MSPVEIHIDELVLDGVAPGDSHRVAQAVAHELARLTLEGGLPAAGARAYALDHLDAGTLPAGLHARPGALGTQIAQAMYEGLGGRHDR